jgi:hypothetical protein
MFRRKSGGFVLVGMRKTLLPARKRSETSTISVAGGDDFGGEFSIVAPVGRGPKDKGVPVALDHLREIAAGRAEASQTYVSISGSGRNNCDGSGDFSTFDIFAAILIRRRLREYIHTLAPISNRTPCFQHASVGRAMQKVSLNRKAFFSGLPENLESREDTDLPA